MLEGKRINLLYLGIRKKSDDTQQMLDAAQRAPRVSESVDWKPVLPILTNS